MSAPCKCGHHRLTHTYTKDGNAGPCLGYRPPGYPGDDHECECSEFTPTEEKK